MISAMRNSKKAAPIIVATNTNKLRSLCLLIAISPVRKAEIPEAIPISIVIAKAGLLTISAIIVPPAGTDLYNELVNDEPKTNNNGIAIISPRDHFPKIVLGINPPIFFSFFLQLYNLYLDTTLQIWRNYYCLY